MASAKRPKAKPAKKAAKKKAKKKAARPAADASRMSPKQKAFCEEYLANGMNATRAAISVGYSPHTADSQGCRLLKNAKVAAELSRHAKKLTADREIRAERILDEIAKLAYFDPRRLFTSVGTLLPIHEMPEEVAAGVTGIEITELFEGRGDERRLVGHLNKIKWVDKGLNLERLGRHKKLFTDRVELKARVIERVLLPAKPSKARPEVPTAPEFEDEKKGKK